MPLFCLIFSRHGDAVVDTTPSRLRLPPLIAAAADAMPLYAMPLLICRFDAAAAFRFRLLFSRRFDVTLTLR